MNEYSNKYNKNANNEQEMILINNEKNEEEGEDDEEGEDNDKDMNKNPFKNIGKNIIFKNKYILII